MHRSLARMAGSGLERFGTGRMFLLRIEADLTWWCFEKLKI